ncbi:ribosomal protein S18-alanine N-acetyltransferase [Methanosphaera cuniculi]|uniref:ribosomal protein S18-alanine N-acetyltransferase n=1 Tax=Methanosphaera cuniculi TaxID=1077256 RepID=UPI0026F12CFB|nr:ribosomal protein S18-alanine N-acetyltransferase [Methanosphaera cuniculi]
MIIRDFKPTDLDEVIRIEYESFSEPYPVDIVMGLYEAGAGFLVAEIASNIVGYIIFWIKDGIGHIIVIAIDSNFRGMQIGTLLLQRAIEIFYVNDICDVKLEVKKSNIRAIHFYQQNGFRQIAEEDKYYSDGETAVIMLHKYEKKNT